MARESMRLLNQRAQGNDIIMTDVFQHMLLNMGVVNNELLRQLRGTLKALAGLFPIGILVDRGGQLYRLYATIRKISPKIGEWQPICDAHASFVAPCLEGRPFKSIKAKQTVGQKTVGKQEA
jgi:hypothetical protein